MFQSPRSLKSSVRCKSGIRFIERLALEDRLRGFRAPGDSGHAAQSNSDRVDSGIPQIQRNSRGSQCKLVGFAVAYFQIQGAALPCCAWNAKSNNQLTRQQGGFDVRGFTRRHVQLLEIDDALTAHAGNFNCGIEHQQSLREVAWIGGDALGTHA